MKVAVLSLFVVLPLAFAAPEKKFILPNPLDAICKYPYSLCLQLKFAYSPIDVFQVTVRNIVNSGDGRPRVPLRELFNGRVNTWVEPPIFRKLTG